MKLKGFQGQYNEVEPKDYKKLIWLERNKILFDMFGGVQYIYKKKDKRPLFLALTKTRYYAILYNQIVEDGIRP